MSAVKTFSDNGITPFKIIDLPLFRGVIREYIYTLMYYYPSGTKGPL
jgi:hypothetical protein